MAAVGYGCYQLAVYASNQIDGIDVEAPEKELKEQKSTKEEGKRKKLKPDSNATSAHTAIKKDPDTSL